MGAPVTWTAPVVEIKPLYVATQTHLYAMVRVIWNETVMESNCLGSLHYSFPHQDFWW